jgi:hypothetical protein
LATKICRLTPALFFSFLITNSYRLSAVKSFVNTKTSNIFLIPEIIFNLSFVLNPHVTLLGLFLANKAFAAFNLTSAKQLSLLNIKPGYN